MTTLAQLAGLRDREVERAARAAREAAAAVDAAAAELSTVELLLETAAMARHAAAARRLLHPADECVALYLQRCEQGVAEAERALEAARQSLEAAETASVQARRDWMRAEARRDAMRGLVEEAHRDSRRAAENRIADEPILRAGARR
ncbi:hypothetical protein COC42_01985 [Sphingomonas spermidinifaciens]|uniref:Flagellar FliJ protein n=1 Tax=Sphingomonas spermidinifaciens TaxID=1141889 RepID=A0A2A4B1Z5_9SPHN|nr:hypothetical protein [Sphingomonas spermidinifaciens]PCD03213.1 hypothetical protein COC42_01985 [Sphingomonas spermidinifaciens]